MPTFKHNLLGIGRLCNHGCTVLFNSDAVTVYSKDNNNILLKGWRDTTGAKLWNFSLRPEDNPVSSIQPEPPQTPTALNTHLLPSVGTAALSYLTATP